MFSKRAAKLISIEKAARLLRQGEVVAFPTETVYGLGADAWNPDAVQKVFDIKRRPADNPLIVHISSINMVKDFAAEIPDAARTLMARFWPGPLTLIFRKKPEVMDIITGGLDTVALRWPGHPISQELISLAGPLVAPSANTSGKPSPTKPEHVKEDFGDDFPVIEAGETQIGLESTVLDTTTEPLTLYRPGYIGKGDIEKASGKIVNIASREGTESASRSPGTRYSHYAPEAKVRWLDPVRHEIESSDDSMFLLHSGRGPFEGKNIVHYHGDFERLARELYDRFRQADHGRYRAIYIQPFTGEQANSIAIVSALKNRIIKAIGKK